MYFQFDQYFVDCEGLKVIHDGAVISDDEKTVKLLGLLCESYPEVAEKEMLLNAIWPDQVVTDWSLSKLVSDTRHVLDQTNSGENPIKTIRGKGFRLTTDVEIIQEKPVVQVPSSNSTSINSSNRAEISSSKLLSPKWIAITASVFLVVSYFTYLNFESKKIPITLSTGEIRVAVLPVASEGNDPSNEWIKYGVMSLVTEQLRHFSSLQVLPSSTVIPISSKLEQAKLRRSFGQYHKELCSQTGCTHIVEIIHSTDDKNVPTISYQIFTEDHRTIIKDFTDVDVIDSADIMLSFLVKDLIPDEKEISSLADTFSQDVKANRDYAIGVNELISGDPNSAMSYLQLALDRHPEFFWAKAKMAEANYRSGSLEKSNELLKILKTEATTAREKYFLAHLESNILYSFGQLDDSLAISLSLLKNSFAVDNSLYLGNELLNIGSSYQAKGELKQAEKYLNQSIEEYRKVDYGSGVGKGLFNLANVFLTSTQPAKAVEYYHKAREIFVRFNMSGYELMAKHQIATTSISLGKLKYAEAELEKLVKGYKEIKDLEGELTAVVDLIYLNVAKKDYQKAERILLSAFEKLNKSKYSYLVDYANKIAVIVYLRLSNLEKAELYYQQINGIWQDNRPAFVFITAQITLARGNISEALRIAEEVKETLGNNWTDRHEDVLEQFREAQKRNRVLPIHS